MGKPPGSKGPPTKGGAESSHSEGKGIGVANNWKAEAVSSRLQQGLLKATELDIAVFRSAHGDLQSSLQREEGWQDLFQESLAKILAAEAALVSDAQSAISDLESGVALLEKHRDSLPNNVLQLEERALAERDRVMQQLEYAIALVDGPDGHQKWQTLRDTQIFVEPMRMMEQPLPGKALRVVCISDTHGKHDVLSGGVPDGDLLVHAGDATEYGEEQELLETLNFLERQSHKDKILIGGNHDLCMHAAFYRSNAAHWPYKQLNHPAEDARHELATSVRQRLRDSAVRYLEDELLELPGARVYGTPWSARFHDWAFNLPRGEISRGVYGKVPEAVDILVSHGPPLGRGDACQQSDGSYLQSGCADLLEEVQTRIRPRVHVFGHVHESVGISSDGTTAFVNATTCTFGYLPLNPPVVFDLPIDRQEAPRFLHPRVDWSSQQLADWMEIEGLVGWANVLLAEAVDGAAICNLDEANLKRLSDAYMRIHGSAPNLPEFLRGVHRLRASHYA